MPDANMLLLVILKEDLFAMKHRNCFTKSWKAISAGLKVIICIGENSKDREKGDYLFVLEEHEKSSDISIDSNF